MDNALWGRGSQCDVGQEATSRDVVAFGSPIPSAPFDDLDLEEHEAEARSVCGPWVSRTPKRLELLNGGCHAKLPAKSERCRSNTAATISSTSRMRFSACRSGAVTRNISALAVTSGVSRRSDGSPAAR